MIEDKRPKATLDMTSTPENTPPPRLELRPGSDTAGKSKNAKSDRIPQQSTVRRGGGFLSHFLAALLGAGVVAAGVYAAFTSQIPGLSLTDPETKRQVRDLQDRVAAVSLRADPAPDADGAGSNELRARLDSAVSALRDLDATVQAANQRLQTLEAKSGTARPASFQTEIVNEITPLSQRLANLERDVDALTRAQSERVADGRMAALTLALTNLKRAIAEGRPFPAELAAVDTLSSAKLPVAQLAIYKDAGVPSLFDLQRDFQAASKKAIEQHYKSSGTFVSSVISRARSAIDVRPANSTGDTIDAVLGRVETQLKGGNVAGALAEANALDTQAQEQMQSWLAAARTRLTADEAIRKTDQDLLASLTKPPARRP